MFETNFISIFLAINLLQRNVVTVGNEDHIMSFSSTLCSAAVTGKFDENIIELILGTHQAAALLLFNASKKLSYCEIKAHLKLTYAGVVRLLQSL